MVKGSINSQFVGCRDIFYAMMALETMFSAE